MPTDSAPMVIALGEAYNRGQHAVDVLPVFPRPWAKESEDEQ